MKKFVVRPLFAPHKEECFCLGHMQNSHFSSIFKAVIPTPAAVKTEAIKSERPLKREKSAP